MKKRKEQTFSVLDFVSSKEFAFLFFTVILICAAVFLSNYWGLIKLNEYGSSAVYFERFDKRIAQGSDFCFDLAIKTQSSQRFDEDFSIFAGENQLLSQRLVFDGKEMPFGKYGGFWSKTFCFDSNFLNFGWNQVSVNTGSNKVFFNIEKVVSMPKQTYSLEMKDLNSEFVIFSLELSSVDSFEPVSIFVNDKLDHKVYPSSEKNVFQEKISLEPGLNKVAVSYKDTSSSKEVSFVPRQKMNFAVGTILFVLGLASFLFFVFAKSELLQKIVLSFAALLFVLVFLGFILNLLGILSLFSFILLYLVIIFGLAFYFRKNFSISEKVSLKDLGFLRNPLVILAVLGVIVVPLIFNIFVVSNYSYWNTYYERQAGTLSANFSLPLVDDLSYFGRPLAFIPGYFFLDAGISWIFGLNGEVLFAVLIIIANILFFGAVLFFGKSLGLSSNRSIMIYLFLWTENFIRGALVISPRHAFSLALFLIAISLLLSNRKKVISGAVLALCAFIQFPLVVAFPFLYLILAKKIEWRSLIKVILVALVIFAVLFSPNFFHFGMLSQAESSNWGYLINYGALNIFLDLGALIVFFFLFTIFDIAKKSFDWSLYNKKLFVAGILGLLFQVYVSYRWNIFNTINIAVFLIIAIPEAAIKNKYFVRTFAILILLTGVITASGIGYLSITNYVINSYDYISYNTSSSENILNDPLFGHNLAFFCDRRILADLAVEYAPEQKLLDDYNFLEQKDYLILKKYEINWVFSQSNFINRKAFGNQPLDKPLEFYKLDKVFANEVIFVHWVGNNKLD